MRRFLILGLLAFLAGGGQALSSPEPAAGPHAQATFRAAADTYTSSASRRRNFGRARVLRAGVRPVTRAYVRINVRGLVTPVTRATLRVYALAASRRGVFVGSTTNRWSERRLTWANERRAFRGLSSSGRIRSRGWVSLNVTRAVSGNGTFNFLLGGRGSTRFSSREGRRAPHLLVQTEEARSETLIAAGDIADCGAQGDEQTAALVDGIPGTVAAVGDLAYEDGTPAEFANCYEPTWGRFKARTKPALGNHEYHTPGAAGYFGYWGAVAGTPGQGWYSYDLGAWHVVVLNSNCSEVACAAGSAQETWLRADLAAHRKACTAAYLHHPRFSSGLVPGSPQLQPLWQALYDVGAELILVGHAHNYQRWAPLNPVGALDPQRGIRQIVVGTGGRALHRVSPQVANQEVVNDNTFGVLRVTLKAKGYDWRFVPVSGSTFTDSGSGTCH